MTDDANDVERSWRSSWKRWTLMSAIAAIAVGTAFAGGYVLADDAPEVQRLESTLADTEADLEHARGEVAEQEAEASMLRDARADLREQLRAERSLNGNVPPPASSSPVVTDLPWTAAGTVGDHTLKPTALEQAGDRWVLTVTAKNEGDTPSNPFCGDAGAVLADGAGREYSGNSVLADDTANCGDDLQPGLTATYKGEFELPPGAEPAAAAIYGDYEYTDDAKVWATP